jgi:hypothetical protein
VLAEETARRTATELVDLPSKFMIDIDTYARGAELGFAGIDFYFAGRAGVLGAVSADVVAACLVFFNPATVHAAWEASHGVMPRLEASRQFAACSHRWAEANLPPDVDYDRLAALAQRAIEHASPAGLPIFAGWRCEAHCLEPVDGGPALALHRLNVLRELRGGCHGLAVLSAGLSAADAVMVHSPYMADIFGWDKTSSDPDRNRMVWDDAEARTNRLAGVAFEALTEDERVEFVDLVEAASDAVAV